MDKINKRNGDANRLLTEDMAAHDWYRFVLSFPPHLVREYAQKFNLHPSHRVLDPFCGTGTTIVECKKLGLDSVGIEANPLAHFACEVKTHWEIDPDELLRNSNEIAEEAIAELELDKIVDDPILSVFNNEFAQNGVRLRGLEPDIEKLILTNSISPLPLHKALVLRDKLQLHSDSPFYKHQLLGLANALVFSISNLKFGPEVGVGRQKVDVPVVGAWLDRMKRIARDLHQLQKLKVAQAVVHNEDARRVGQIVEPVSIDAVFTSPPYPNEKDYTRTTRLEAVMLGFVNNKAELQALKRNLLRSNTRGVYKGDDDDLWVNDFPEIQRIAEMIEARRIELGKTSGFERLYARVTKLYFGGMARHLADLRPVLKPGAQLGYVVGDQASYLRVMIRTGEILGDIAKSLGYEVVGIDLFRTRLATATKDQLREEVLLLRWPG